MRLTLTRLLRYSVTLTVALLALLCAGLVWQIERMDTAAHEMAHTEEVINRIDLVQKNLLDQETALRGFLLAEQTVFLDPYVKATTAQQLDQLEQIVAGDPEQTARVRALRAAYLAWKGDADASIAHPALGWSLDHLLLRKSQMDMMRVQVRGLLDPELARHARQRADAARDKRIAETVAGAVLLAVFGVGTLLTRRAIRRALTTYEDALARSERSELRLRRLWDSNILGILYAKVSGQITDANDAVLHMIGYTREEVLAGRVHWTDLTPPEYHDIDERGVTQMVEHGACMPYEKEYIAKDGHRVPILIGYALLGGAEEDGICFLVDLTERTQLLAAERAARTEAERASHLKDEFVATVSHELRTPLSTILGWTRLLQRPCTAPDQLAKGLDVIARNTHQLNRLVSDLLDTSRIVTGKLTIEPEPVDLPAVVDATLEGLASAAAAKGVTIETAIAPVGSDFLADPKRLHQVIENLVSNAIKFTPTGGRVRVTLSSTPASVTLSVRDDGEGIAPEFLPHIFDRFRQADASVKRRHGGLGLGLAIVKQIVDLHGGSIHVASEGSGRGSEFTVTLPLAPPLTTARPSSPTEAPSLAGVRVLLVDDEPDARDVAQRILEESGAHVHAACSGAEAILLAAGAAPDVVISDVGMPVMDGYELVRRLRAAPGTRDVPMIALTAFARLEDRTRALEAGFDTHLAKPVEPATLVGTLGAVLHRRRWSGVAMGAAT